MKKIKYLLLLLLLIPMLSVRAERINCGSYAGSEGVIYAYIEDGTLKIPDYGVVARDLDTCPYAIYKWYCDWPDPAYSYKLTQSDGTWPCEDAGTFKMDGTNPYIPDPNDDPSHKYDDSVLCNNDNTYTYIGECGCMPVAVADLTSRLYNILKIAVPILLLIIGGFGLVKAITAADEKAIQKEQTKLIKKFVAAVIIFLLFAFAQLIVSMIARNSESTIRCVDYIINGYNDV